jgi:MarR family transcriptional regulator, organic hydroperoxide resistance regulator
MSKDNLIPLDGQLCFSIYSAWIAINRLYKPLLDELGLTYPQYLVLSALWERDGQKISDIADRLLLVPSTITPVVKRLEVAQFVERHRNIEDEREMQVFLTAKGREVQPETACLTAALLRQSGMAVEEIISLNNRVREIHKALAGDE